jgi:hypothetical protein
MARNVWLKRPNRDKDYYYEIGVGHHLRLRPGRRIGPARANGVAGVHEAASSGLLSASLHHALLFGETFIEFAAHV